MKAAVYTRVSSAAQATEEKVSLTEQRIDIERYCEQRGHEIVEWYQDVGSGASKRRADFQHMLKDSQSNKFELIVAWKSDRLSRGMYPAAALMEALEGTDIKLEAVKDTIDINTFGILAAVGKIELDNIRQRVSMGMRGRARRGKAPSHIRFGYKKDEEGYPVVNESEAKQLAQETNLVKGARKILSWGPKILVVKRGEYGVLMFHMDSEEMYPDGQLSSETSPVIFGAPAYPLEQVFDPTGAGDSFAGGFVGYLAGVDRNDVQATRQAIIFGSVMASFCVEKFSLERLRELTFTEIEMRYREFREMTCFEDIA